MDPGDASSPRVSVVVPAYNEELLLRETVESVSDALAAMSIRASIIIVNDGSIDRSGEIADTLAREREEVIALHQENTGIGGALRAGIAAANGRYLLVWPADMPCCEDDLRPFLDVPGDPDVIVGCRKKRIGYNPIMHFNAWIYPFLVKWMFGLRLRDVNWISLYRTRMAKEIQITQNGIPMLTEILVRIRDLGGSFLEVEVDMKPREGGVASASRFKVMWRTLAGLFSFWKLWRKERRLESK